MSGFMPLARKQHCEEEARQRAEDIRATEEASAQAAAADTVPSPRPRSRRSTDPAASTTTPTRPRPNGPGSAAAAARATRKSRWLPRSQPRTAPLRRPNDVPWVDCSHKLGPLPCMNHKPHEGNGRGCVPLHVGLPGRRIARGPSATQAESLTREPGAAAAARRLSRPPPGAAARSSVIGYPKRRSSPPAPRPARADHQLVGSDRRRGSIAGRPPAPGRSGR